MLKKIRVFNRRRKRRKRSRLAPTTLHTRVFKPGMYEYSYQSHNIKASCILILNVNDIILPYREFSKHKHVLHVDIYSKNRLYFGREWDSIQLWLEIELLFGL